MILKIDGKFLDPYRIVCSCMDYGHRTESKLHLFEFILSFELFMNVFRDKIDTFISDSKNDYCDEDDSEPSLNKLKEIGFLECSVLFRKHPSVLANLIKEYFIIDLLSEVMSDDNKMADYIVYKCESLIINGEQIVIKGTAKQIDKQV